MPKNMPVYAAAAGPDIQAAAALPIDSDPLRLAASMVIAALAAAAAGTLVGIPVLRLNGDYLAIVTLAFGQIKIGRAHV